MSNKDFPSSKFDRSKIMAKTGLKIGTNYAKFHMNRALGKTGSPDSRRELNRTNAGELFKEFSKLRGTALKLAQGLSLDNSILPEEFTEVMTQAQYGVPPINKVLVRSIIKKELGDWPENLFAEFEPEAAAAASLGQVHRAVLKDGRKVAVKVQYPNVRETIKSDLVMARVIFKSMVSSDKTDEYFDEVRDKLMEETDYRKEGEHIDTFRKRYHGNGVMIPEWIPEFSTGSVLTMTWIDGRHLNEFLKENPSQDERDHYGQQLWDFFHLQLNDSFTVHADSHPGNYLFKNDGNLGVLDFGCVKECPRDFFMDYLNLFTAHRTGDKEKIKELYFRLEILEKGPDKDAYESRFLDYTMDLGKLFVSPYNHDFFDFGDETFVKEFIRFSKEAVEFREPKGSRHFIYVARAHIGMYQMLMKMKARIDIRPGRTRLYDFLEENGIG